MESNLAAFLSPFLQPKIILLVAIGTFAGIWIGAIPGLTVTMATTLLISLTFGWDVYSALALIAGVFCGGVYGGSRSAVLINVPGAPAAIAATFDGYPLALMGEAGRAIGISTVQCFVGGMIGVLILAVGAPAISKIALGFAPRDYFLIAIMGILLVGSMGAKRLSKAIIAASLGIFLGMIGLDPMTAEQRFSYGNIYLMSGINYIAVMIGLFGLSEALVQIKERKFRPPVIQKIGKVWPPLRLTLKYIPLTLQTSILGTIVGALPGTGGDIAALLAYAHARRVVKNPEPKPFGKGAYQGLVAPESASSAAIGGAFIPMLTLGVPGDAVTAVIIGALFIHGLRPGPMLMIEMPHFFWFIVGSLVLGMIFMLIFGMMAIKPFVKMIQAPKSVLVASIVVLSVIGTYAIQASITDVFWMVGSGLLGYILRKYEYPLGPVVLGIILGPLMDVSLRRALISVQGNIWAFFKEIVTHPISLVLFLLIVAALALQSRIRKEEESLLGQQGALEDANRA